MGDEHPQFGLARNSWLTGPASWAYQAGIQSILGIRPSYNGLMVDPCIPRDWDGFELSREFRNANFKIIVQNPDHVSKGVKTMEVHGLPVNGNFTPLFQDSQEHTIQVVLG